jgi:hypothetical protein
LLRSRPIIGYLRRELAVCNNSTIIRSPIQALLIVFVGIISLFHVVGDVILNMRRINISRVDGVTFDLSIGDLILMLMFRLMLSRERLVIVMVFSMLLLIFHRLRLNRRTR